MLCVHLQRFSSGVLCTIRILPKMTLFYHLCLAHHFRTSEKASHYSHSPQTLFQITEITNTKIASSSTLYCFLLLTVETALSSQSSLLWALAIQGSPSSSSSDSSHRRGVLTWLRLTFTVLLYWILKERKSLLDCLLPNVVLLLRICDAFSNEEVPNALKVVDFSHSLDLRVLPRVSLPYNFPTAQTPHGQQLLTESSLPYQVSLYLVGHLNFCVSFTKPIFLS